MQVTIHTDTLNESGCLEETLAAFKVRPSPSSSQQFQLPPISRDYSSNGVLNSRFQLVVPARSDHATAASLKGEVFQSCLEVGVGQSCRNPYKGVPGFTQQS